jgi:hypothetical protein
MKRLRLFFAVHLLLVALLPGSDLQALQRMGQSVAHHFQDHHHSGHGISLVSFLLEHLANPEHDHEHEHTNTGHLSNPAAPSMYVAVEPAVLPELSVFTVFLQKATSYYRSSEPVAIATGIWQPPRA